MGGLAVLFVIPVVIDVYGHRFEVFPLVSEIHDNVDLVLGMKNVFELEAIDLQYSSFKFLHRSIPFFLKEQLTLKTKGKEVYKNRSTIYGWDIRVWYIKMLYSREQCMVVLKLKFIRNWALLDITNNTQETVIFDPKEMIGILDFDIFRFLQNKAGCTVATLSKYYHFESADRLCEEFNTLVNELNKDKKILDKEKYLWLEDLDEWKYMMGKEILVKCIDLDKSYLTESEKREVRDMIYKYKVAFSLRDDIGTYPNIEIDIDITDKIQFFIRPYHVKEKDKKILDKQMKRVCYLGIVKEHTQVQ